MKKRLFSILLCMALVLGMAACGKSDTSQTKAQENDEKKEQDASQEGTEPEDADEPESQAGQASDGKALIVYFSVPETDSAEDMNAEEKNSTVVIDGEVLGNTQYVAYVIQENTGADIFRIEPKAPYPMDHAELEEVATEEKSNNAMPEIAAEVENMEQYNTVFLGYPNWYADMPRIIYSFLDKYDLSDKTVVPFVTSGGSGFSDTINTITELEPEAEQEKDCLQIQTVSSAYSPLSSEQFIYCCYCQQVCRQSSHCPLFLFGEYLQEWLRIQFNIG